MDISKIGKPVTRQELGEMKKKEEEKNRWNSIYLIINRFYNEVIKHAKNNDNQKYVFDIINNTAFINNDFIKNNNDDILNSVKLLFPDSKLSIKQYINNNGESYDITELDENSKKIFDKNKYILMLVIEW
jgi:hypothetical protein